MNVRKYSRVPDFGRCRVVQRKGEDRASVLHRRQTCVTQNHVGSTPAQNRRMREMISLVRVGVCGMVIVAPSAEGTSEPEVGERPSCGEEPLKTISVTYITNARDLAPQHHHVPPR